MIFSLDTDITNFIPKWKKESTVSVAVVNN